MIELSKDLKALKSLKSKYEPECLSTHIIIIFDKYVLEVWESFKYWVIINFFLGISQFTVQNYTTLSKI